MAMASSGSMRHRHASPAAAGRWYVLCERVVRPLERPTLPMCMVSIGACEDAAIPL